MTQRAFFLTGALAGLLFYSGPDSTLAAAEPTASKPNVIYILADDLGYGDLSCYGQKTLSTPHLDRMAAEGMRFTRHYSGSTVCAPSRCVLVTGFHTGHARIRGNGPGALEKSDLTFGTVLQRSGYVTGCFGKWGIGNPPPLNDPEIHGFDEFYGYINMYHAHNYYPEFLIRNGRKVPLRNVLYEDWKEKRTGEREGAGVAKKAVDYAPQLIFDEMMKFVDANAEKGRRFFAFYSLNIPHANNEGGGEPRIDRNGMRVPEHGRFASKDWPDPEKGFARMIQTIDDHVGRIIARLKEHGLDDNTLILFSSDNGPHNEGGHKHTFFDSNGPLRGFKRDLYEGGIRAPFIVRWPARVRGGQVSDHISGFQDVMPTLCELVGVPSPPTDGISFLPVLLGREQQQRRHPYLYWEFYERGEFQAVVHGDWKGIALKPKQAKQTRFELYNLAEDIGEETDVADRHPEMVARLKGFMKAAHLEP